MWEVTVRCALNDAKLHFSTLWTVVFLKKRENVTNRWKPLQCQKSLHEAIRVSLTDGPKQLLGKAEQAFNSWVNFIF